MILDKNPIARVFPVAIDRKGNIVKGIRHEKRNKLFRVLIRAIVVAAPRNHDRNLVRRPIRKREAIRPRFARRIRRKRHERVGFQRGAADAFRRHRRAIDFVRADMHEPADRVFPRRFQ